MSNFDPSNFLSMQVDATFADKFTNVPEGEYPAQINDVSARTVNTKHGERVIVSLKWLILDPNVAATMNLENPTIKQDIWLDFEENGTLATGVNKNIGIGRLRKAVHQESNPWSFAKLNGASARVKVRHSLDDKNQIRAEVSEVVSA